METTRLFAGRRTFGIVAVLAAGMALITSVPVATEAGFSLAPPLCGTGQPESDEPWVGPPMQVRPGEPY